MKAQLIIWFVILCAPGILPAAFFYARHCNQTLRGVDRFPLGLYVVLLPICAFVAFWAGVGWGAWYACNTPSRGNLCGLLGVFAVGPLSSFVAVSIVSWLMTSFPRQMKWIAPIGVTLIFLGGYYYAYQLRTSPPGNVTRERDAVRYRLQSDNVDDLHRYVPMIEAQLRELHVVRDVRLDSRFESEQAAIGVEPQKPTAGIKQLPTMTITFTIVPNVAYGDAIAQIRNLEMRLAIPTTIRTSVARVE